MVVEDQVLRGHFVGVIDHVGEARAACLADAQLQAQAVAPRSEEGLHALCSIRGE